MSTEEELQAPAYVKDVRNLLQSFVEAGNPTSFAAFKELWKERGFSFIHEGCPRQVNPRRYSQILFSVALGFLRPYRRSRRLALAPFEGGTNAEPAPDPVQDAPHQLGQGQRPAGVTEGAAFPTPKEISFAAGAIYMAYCLFHTQHQLPRTLVYVDPEDLDGLLAFASDAGVLHRAWEAVHCLRRMQKDRAFLFGAVPFREGDALGGTQEQAIRQRVVLEKQISVMREKLLGNLQVEEHFAADLMGALGIKAAEQLGQAYEAALKALPTPPAPHRSAPGGSNGDGQALFVEPNRLSRLLEELNEMNVKPTKRARAV